MAFTGQVLRFDQDSYWGLGIGASILGRVPLVGAQLVHVVLAGPIIAGETLSRFFTLHVFVIPGAILAIVSLHLRLVLTKGINEYPTPGKVVRRSSYELEYEEEIRKTGVPFWPNVIGKDLIFSAALTVAILTCAAVSGPAGPSGPPDPALIQTAPKPDFFFLSVYAVLALLPPYMETFLILTAPLVGITALMLLPFFSGEGEKSVRRRPVAVLTVVVASLTLVILAWLGTYAPWSPRMEAWSATPVPVQYLQGRTPLERRGAALIQSKQCRNCHALDGGGGLRGPALDGVARRLTGDQLIRQVIQGGGNMPAYGKNLRPAEVTALVAFMQTLR
jgi:ubiquinol-cytochrome c reductase cytochrome b subunit